MTNYKELLNRYDYPKDGYEYVAKCKIDGLLFKDYLNTSGALIRHLRDVYHITIPTQYKRKTWSENNNMLWYEQYYDIIQMEKQETKKCKYCDWETIDIDNKSGMYKTHLLKAHDKDIEDYLIEYPEEREYFTVDSKKNDFINNESEWVECKICGKKLKRIDWKHLTKHNISLYDYKILYDNKTVSDNLHDTLSKQTIQSNLSVPNDRKYTSNTENDICEFLLKNNIHAVKNRSLLCGKEIDMYVEDKNIAIEYDGLRWHSESFGKDRYYHLNKTLQCKEQGVNLIHIFEDEYINSKEIVLNKLKHILEINNELPKIMGRKCIIEVIDNNTAKEFLNMYHIQGYGASTIHLGAVYDNELIAVMSFKKEDKECLKWELTRFVSNYNYRCQGVGGKLFKYFIKNYNPNEIKSFADRRWTLDEGNNLYTKLGFELSQILPPDYRYYNERVDKYQRFHKFGFRKQILNKKYNLPLTMTESEMIKELGYDKIWDCGLLKYVWKKENK